eukprot:CAMPEP_0202862472 /NCGR_PEP_ID=MMETSP1391-20130828/3505_1 /ASSEMBLY_ACC=CAM_ASM_000867 /TAXON_ID=1034604 /ORGANISM="Chlamydomonas leiostraca, Strain SAG 11-49" /LENGTH=30 /DNA_ID= /DNA_START= /DNA_END= /DNA_ORIENTATION=
MTELQMSPALAPPGARPFLMAPACQMVRPW